MSSTDNAVVHCSQSDRWHYSGKLVWPCVHILCQYMGLHLSTWYYKWLRQCAKLLICFRCEIELSSSCCLWHSCSSFVYRWQMNCQRQWHGIMGGHQEGQYISSKVGHKYNKALCHGELARGYTHIHLTAFFPGQPGYAGTRKVNHSGFYWSKRWRDGSGISWTFLPSFIYGGLIAKPQRWGHYQLDHMQIICTTLRTDNHASTPSLSFLQAGCSSWCPTNSVKVLKAKDTGRGYCQFEND